MLRFVNQSGPNLNESNADLSRWYTGGTATVCSQAAEPEQYVCDPNSRPPRAEARNTQWDCQQSEDALRAAGLCREREAAELCGSLRTANHEVTWGNYDTCAQVEQCVPLQEPCLEDRPEEFRFKFVEYNDDKPQPPAQFFSHEQLENPVDDKPVARIDAGYAGGLTPIHAPELNPDQQRFPEHPPIYHGEREKGRFEQPLSPIEQRADVPRFQWA
jgi:hypothetical protein